VQIWCFEYCCVLNIAQQSSPGESTAYPRRHETPNLDWKAEFRFAESRFSQPLYQSRFGVSCLRGDVGGINYDWQLAGPPGAPRVFTLTVSQRRTGSSFPWQSLALELIPNGSRPNNYLIATAKSYKEYGRGNIRGQGPDDR
jgi:hypothetical protein